MKSYKKVRNAVTWISYHFSRQAPGGPCRLIKSQVPSYIGYILYVPGRQNLRPRAQLTSQRGTESGTVREGGQETCCFCIMETVIQWLLLLLLTYQSLYGLKTYNLSEATYFHIRAFHLPTNCHMMQLKGTKRLKLAINWPQNGN